MRSRLMAAALVMAAAQATAGTIAEKAAEAEAMIAAGNAAGAVKELRSAMAALWEETEGIGFTEATLLQGDAALFGIYTPHPTGTFKQGEPIKVYAEPIGYAFQEVQPGIYQVGLEIDLKVLDANGLVLGEVPNISQIGFASREKNTEFHANLTYNLNNGRPGKYQVVTTMRDKFSDRTGEFVLEIEIVE